MNMQEWKTRTGHDATPEEWEIINTVYNHHPIIGEQNGKEDIARFYLLGGMGLLGGMLTAAMQAREFEDAIMAAARAKREAEIILQEIGQDYSKFKAQFCPVHFQPVKGQGKKV